MSFRDPVAPPLDADLYDPVTGLPSAALQREHLRLALKRAHRSGSHVALLFLDVDDFHTINERLGRQVGDQVLNELGMRLRDRLRDTDVVSRLDGDEFVIVCEDLDEPRHVGALIRRVNDALHDPLEIDGTVIDLRGSIGSAVSPGREHPGEMLNVADKQMAEAKRGRHRIRGEDASR